MKDQGAQLGILFAYWLVYVADVRRVVIRG